MDIIDPRLIRNLVRTKAGGDNCLERTFNGVACQIVSTGRQAVGVKQFSFAQPQLCKVPERVSILTHLAIYTATSALMCGCGS